jgi:hypothetical protein
MTNPLDDIKVDLGVDKPLWVYVREAIQDIEVFNILGLNPIEDPDNPIGENDDPPVTPFIHIGNWEWNPHPLAEEIQYRRRETGNKLSTKLIGDTRIGILEFDILYGARDKNKNLEEGVIHNKIYIPIEDDHGRYLIENVLYSEYQLVDKLLYPSGKDSITLKSLLPIIVSYEEASETSIDGYVVESKIGMVKIFTTMEPILSCFMHVPAPLSYLGVFPILQFCDRVLDDKDDYAYFKPDPNCEVYIKGFKKGLEKFDYVRSILVMACQLIKKHKPESIDKMMNPKWWVYKLSYYDTLVEHRGACHEMHVARMLDTISAQVLPIPEIDKRNMISLLRYVLQTEFDNVNVYSYDNKRLRLNEVTSTIVTAEVSDKLKRMFKFGILITVKDMQPLLKFHPQLILKNMHKTGTTHVADFANDLDYYQLLRFTKNGPNSLGRLDKHKINFAHRQMHPSMIGKIDLLESPKDVGQSGMISPWADLTEFANSDINKYPNIKFELFQFIYDNFPNPTLRFNANNIVDYNRILDKLVTSTYINLDYHIKKGDSK